MTKKNSKNHNVPSQSKKTKKKGKKSQKIVMGHPEKSLKIQECTYKYMLAKTNPWSPEAAGACVPMDNMAMSQKNHAFMRQTVTVGINGIAWVAILPCLANDTPCIYYTLTNFAGDGSTPINIGTSMTAIPAQASFAYLPTPYTSAQLLDTGSAATPVAVKGRIVSAGFKFWYSGTELERSGWMAPYVSPQHGTIEGYSVNGLISWQTTNVIPTNSSKKHQSCVYGVRDAEFAYPVSVPSLTVSYDSVAALYPYSSGIPLSHNAAQGAPIAVVMFRGQPGQTYEFEYCQHSEYVGQPCNFAATKNSSDPEGATLVNEAIQAVADDPTKETTTENVVRRMRQIIEEHGSHMIDLGGAAARAFFGSEHGRRAMYSIL